MISKCINFHNAFKFFGRILNYCCADGESNRDIKALGLLSEMD